MLKDIDNYEEYPYDVCKMNFLEIKKQFERKGYKIVKQQSNIYDCELTNITKFILKNSNGYLVISNIKNINNLKGLVGVVHQSNPYLFDNIDLWTEINKLPFIFLRDRYYEPHLNFRVSHPLSWQCKKDKHHVWRESWKKIKDYDDCPFCEGVFTDKIEESLLMYNLDLVNEIDKKVIYYDPKYLKPDSNIKLHWLCPKCGNKYDRSIRDRTVKMLSCPICEKNNFVSLKNIGIKYPKLIKYWHPFRNELSPYEIRENENPTIWFKCPQHGGKCGHVWSATLKEAIKLFKFGKDYCPNGAHYCPYCLGLEKNKLVEEKEEIGLNKYIYNYFIRNGFNTKREVKIGAISPKGHEMPYDIAILDKEDLIVLLIEYQGEQHTKYVKAWHKSKKGFEYQKLKDRMKEEYCIEKGLDLRVIHYYEKKHLNAILKTIVNELLHKL
jgi:hypothetical protein